MPTEPQIEEIKPPEGIVNNAVAEDQYKAPEVKPITTEVDPAQETVEERLNKLTASSSKYIDLAKSDAMRSANTRGLINSSIAAGAGTEAAIRQALPIAQQDAKTYTDTRFTNQAAENEFLRNRQSADLNIETAAAETDLAMQRDVTQSEQRIAEAGAQSQFDIDRDKSSAALNESLAAFESDLKMSEMELDAQLKTDFETVLNDEKFSDEMKLQMVSTMNNIIRDSNQQITDIGLSDRTATQQATAIEMVKENRDAELAVYQDLLTTFDDWDWGTDFTPESTTTLAEDSNYWNAPSGAKPVNEPKVGDVIDNKVYEGNGVWNEAPPSADNNYGYDSYYDYIQTQ